MGKEAQETVVLDDEVQKKLDDCVAAVTAMRYGPDGPPENTTFAQIEQFGHEVGRMMGRAVDQQLASQHAEQFQKAAVCPTCQTVCEPKPSLAEREIQTSDGQVPLAELVCHCSACHRDFFPQRMALKIDGRSYSPIVLQKISYCAATHPAYHLASEALDKIGNISITGRHIGNLAEGVGEELAGERDARTDAYFQRTLPRVRTDPSTPIPLATVSIDGGRMQTREEGGSNGVQQPHWRETKNALFMRMTGVAFKVDPHPELPECFRDRRYMKKLLSGLAEEGDFEPEANKAKSKSDLRSWRPERLFRTCLSSLAGSQSFGRMMEAEADSRGFFKAAKRAFVGDGLPYNWTIQQRNFPTFTPILDLPHAIEHVYEAARALHGSGDRVWELYVRWITQIWQGQAADVLQEMQRKQSQHGEPPKDCEKKDPRKVLAGTITYLRNNLSRMDYPRYRQEGLPLTSAHMESLVKEIGYRVKGTEKFWNDGKSAESILQIRAAALCDDDRLGHHQRNRPYHPNVQAMPAMNTAA